MEDNGYMNENELDEALLEAEEYLNEDEQPVVQIPDNSGSQSDLTHLQAVLTRELYNIRILHWKVYTKNFDGTHTMMDMYTDVIRGYIDEVAEMCMMINSLPCTMEQAASVGSGISMEKDYDRLQAFQELDGIFKRLIVEYEKASNLAIPDDMKDILKSHLYYIRKEAQYKNARRLSGNNH